ncbi:MAG: rod shape-determining protein RodA [Pseudomonadota bacterium]
MPLADKMTVRMPILAEWPLICLCLILSGIGLVLIYSSTVPLGDAGKTFLYKQMMWLSMGLVLMALGTLSDYHVLERWGMWFYIGIIVALVVVWGAGKVIGGSRRWIEIGFMRFQPSEFAKLAVVVVLAKYFHTRCGRHGEDVRELFEPLLLTAIPVLLVLVQPDLGTAGIIVLVALSMACFAGIGRRALKWVMGVLLVILPVLVFMGDSILMDYQKRRLLTYVNPDHDPLGAGYHIIQSQIAIGAGGFFGQGFLQGTQNQLMFLPVKHTDFIFSILAEEWGFLGCAAVLSLYGAVFLRGLAVAAGARDHFGALLTFGCTSVLFWHVTVNAGMVMGLLPVVGVPLSFISYGGSSLMASYMAISAIANVSSRRFTY